MSSIIEGYNYDIFISYRQKDNKGDRWVSEFVEALKTELESTFKEEISVYFDINPHDGLLETHDVDASLKDKLRCLIFIPIISRTYCDPKSFAWEHEFKAFIELASKDQYGLKVKLPGGNVASRMLPIQIHDLDTDDKNLVESELGGFMRGIEFIYKEPGVNRPLIANEDHPDNNLNKTFYRNQINKVANAIKEIITGLKSSDSKEDVLTIDTNKNNHGIVRNKRTKVIVSTLIILALVILGYFIASKQFKPSEQLEKSIAVLPFHNFSDDPKKEYMSDGLTAETISHLYKIKSFARVVPLSSVLPYKGTMKRLSEIAGELKVNYILSGTYKKIGDKIRVTAELIEPRKDKQLWENQYDGSDKEVIQIQADIALQIADHLNAFLTSQEKQNIKKIPTVNQKAYDLLQQAFYVSPSNTSFASTSKEPLDLILKAIELDPNYADAYASAGIYILGMANYGGGAEMQSGGWKSLHYFEKALEIDPDNGAAQYGTAQLNDWFTWDFVKANNGFQKALELLPKYEAIGSQYGEFLMKMNRLNEAKSFFKSPIVPFANQYREIRREILAGFTSEASISVHAFLDQWKENGYIWAAEAYIWLEKYDSSLYYFKTVDPSIIPEILIPRFQACLALTQWKTGNKSLAESVIKKMIVKAETTSAMSPDFFIGWYYSGIGKADSSFFWLEKAFKSRSPELPWLKVDPIFRNLKKDPRYWALYERTGHKAYDDFISGIKK